MLPALNPTLTVLHFELHARPRVGMLLDRLG